MTVETIWRKIAISELEVSLHKVLRCGQTFRWKSINNVWSFAISDRIILLKQDQNNIYYSHIMQKGRSGDDLETLSFINDYFTLGINLGELYTHWKSKHQVYQSKTKNHHLICSLG